MRTFTVITSLTDGVLKHEIFDFLIPKKNEERAGEWFLPFGSTRIPLGKRDLDKLLQTGWKKIPCSARGERRWSGQKSAQPLICDKCGEKYGNWQPYKIGFECFHPANGEMVLSDKIISNAFCLKLRDKYTEEYSGKLLLVAPDKEQEEALIHWDLSDHAALFEDGRIIAQDTWPFRTNHYLVALKPGSSLPAIKSHEQSAAYTLVLSFDGNSVHVTKKELVARQEVSDQAQISA